MNNMDSMLNDINDVDRMRVKANNYLNALVQVYDKIFEFDLENETIKCLHGGSLDMLLDETDAASVIDTVSSWIDERIYPDDRMAVRGAFERFFYKPVIPSKDASPFQIEFRMLSGGIYKNYLGVLLVMEEKKMLFCCCDITKQREADKLKKENLDLKDVNNNIKEVVKFFADGMVAFKVENEVVTPLYISENICDFFGTDTEVWIQSMASGKPLNELIAKSSFTYEDFKTLIREGKVEKNYIDVATDEERRMKAVSTTTLGENGPIYYIMLHDVTAFRKQEIYGNNKSKINISSAKKVTEKKKNVYIRTFGYFDVFVDGKPIAFRNEKAKELFAFLVDRRGGFVSSSEAITILWEDEPVNKITMSRYRKVALRLKNFLDEYGISDIVENVDGKRRIAVERIQCDLYDYLTRDPKYEHLFNGLYLLNYSWAETTIGELSALSGQTGDRED